MGLGWSLVTGGMAGCASEQKTDEPVNVTLMREYSPDADRVEVTLDVGSIAMPEIVSSGWTNFVVRNNDNVSHVFAIRGNGQERTLDRIEPGQMQTMRIELQPGTYEVYCADCARDTMGITRQLIVAKW
jgi:hypothetical protein